MVITRKTASMGMPKIEDAATALYDSLIPMMGLPSEIRRARPRTAVSSQCHDERRQVAHGNAHAVDNAHGQAAQHGYDQRHEDRILSLAQHGGQDAGERDR